MAQRELQLGGVSKRELKAQRLPPIAAVGRQPGSDEVARTGRRTPRKVLPKPDGYRITYEGTLGRQKRPPASCSPKSMGKCEGLADDL